MRISETDRYNAMRTDYSVRDFVERKLADGYVCDECGHRDLHRYTQRAVACLVQALADKGILDAEQVLEIATGYKTHFNIEVLTQQED